MAVTQGTCFVVAQGPEGAQEMYDFTGHQRGWELITHGLEEEFLQFPHLMDFSLELTRDTVALAACKQLKATDKDVVVVTDPHYNALVCHEVVGHPTELDRALKFETGYAGRSWFLRRPEGQPARSGSAPTWYHLQRPTIDGFGLYVRRRRTPAKRVYHFDKGISTASPTAARPAIKRPSPTATTRPPTPRSCPSSACQHCLCPGDRDPHDIIREVEDGYYVVGHRIPSIAESRENFRITAMKVYEIKNGRSARCSATAA
jgi:TldD protein